MAKASKAAKVMNAPVVSLAEIVAATLANSFMYLAEADTAELVANGMVELNREMFNDDGIATRATPKGIEFVNGNSAAAPAATNTKASAFALDDNVPLPKPQRGGRNGTIYPFDTMNPGQSFFVEATAERPDPAKALASTVSGATARFAVGTGRFETVTVKNYKTGEDSKRVKDAEGKFIVESETQEQQEVMEKTREFVVRAVTENGVKGARIWRMK